MPINLEKNRDSHGRRVVLAYAIASVCAFSANSAIFWFASCWRRICKQRKRNTDIQKTHLLSHNLQALPGTSEQHLSYDHPLLHACLCCVMPSQQDYHDRGPFSDRVCLPTTSLLHACCASSITGTIMLESYICI